MGWLENLFISQNDKQKIEEIKLYIQQENYNRALLELDILIGDKPLFIDILPLKALCYIKTEQYKQALNVLDKIFTVEKDHKEAIYYSGLVFKRLGSPDKAIESLRRAINLGFTIPEIYNDLALVYIQQNEIDKALAQLKIALSKSSFYMPTYKNIIPILIKNEDYNYAIELCNQALSIKNDSEINQLLAQCYQNTDKTQEAINLLEKLIKGNQQSKEIYNSLIKFYLQINDYDSALEKLDEALNIYPADLNLKTRKLELFYKLEKFDYLVNFSKTILSKDIKDPELLAFMGIGYFYNDLKDKAKSFFENSREIEKNFLNTCYLALYHFEKNEFESSEPVLLESLDYTNNKTEKFKINQKLCELYFQTKNYDKALDYSKTAIENASESEKLIIQDLIKDIHKNKFEAEKDTDEHKNYYIKTNNEVYNWIKQIKYYLKKYPKFEFLENKIDEIIYELNQPLNIAVMGEFKAGKSTFINALIGKELAPMGVTPTTATLNFFKYGEKDKIRVIKGDTTFIEADLKDISKYVDERVLNKETIEEISYIEILSEWEKLKEINVIDTPGLNAGIKRHEDITQEFIKKADTVIWIFDVEQAGKQSEKKVLDKIKELSKNLIAVINGIDKVDDPDEMMEVKEYLGSNLEGYFETIIGVSAKKALSSKLNDNNEIYQKSGFTELEKYLEDNIFSKISNIKINSIVNNINKLFVEIAEIIQISRLDCKNNIFTLNEYKQKISLFEHEINSTEFLAKTKLKSDFNNIIQKVSKEIKEYIKPAQGILETVLGKNKFEQHEKDLVLETLKKEIKISFENYSNSLKDEIKNKSKYLIEHIEKSNLIFESNDLIFLNLYNQQKNQNIYNDVIYPNYRYYQGFIDAGIMDNVFNEVSNEINISQDKIDTILNKHLPDIFDNLNNDFNNWKQDYINFLNLFVDNIIKRIKDSFSDLDTNIFEQLLLLNEK